MTLMLLVQLYGVFIFLIVKSKINVFGICIIELLEIGRDFVEILFLNKKLKHYLRYKLLILGSN